MPDVMSFILVEKTYTESKLASWESKLLLAMDDTHIDQRTRLLYQDLADGIKSASLCSITTAIYDTAWLSMVSKTSSGVDRWLFPEAFRYLHSQQLPDGGWMSYATREDVILDFLAALLALKRHQGSSNADVLPASSTAGTKLQDTIARAIQYLENSLQGLEFDGSLQAGFEILVPALLNMPEDEDVHLSFPRKSSLLAISQVKMETFTPDLFYGMIETTLLHSLEALIGRIEFDRIRYRKIHGSMMGSPASTAANLMDVFEWDKKAAMYLRRVVLDGPGKGNGSFPGVFPSPVFELSWVLSIFTFTEDGTYITLGHVNSIPKRLFQRSYGLRRPRHNRVISSAALSGMKWSCWFWYVTNVT